MRKQDDCARVNHQAARLAGYSGKEEGSAPGRRRWGKKERPRAKARGPNKRASWTGRSTGRNGHRYFSAPRAPGPRGLARLQANQARLYEQNASAVVHTLEVGDLAERKYRLEKAPLSPPNMLEAALAYAEEGIAVFPLARGTKIPLKRSHGFKDATTDPDQIREWWTKTPNANIGAAMGAASGIIGVDVDGPEGRATERRA